ncbi:phosphotransferase family protein [Corynebacterium lizhenjunii]|uniref:phosphotransferase family protein n=1 Tax=Corynebacterium lizhenjunii TaxID=2709394 RepID=UPI001FD0A4E6|nr:phosphotransferase [Corynebacterium lizhenjunii]
MSNPESHPLSPADADSVVAVAHKLLTRRFGGSPELTEVEVLSGSGTAVVVRARLAPSAFLPHRSVVVKHMPVTGSPIDDAAFLREVVAYQFTTSLPQEVRPGPVLLAYDMDSRIVVLTDIGEAETLIAALNQASESKRVHLLRLLGEQLGRMHAGTATREQDYEHLLNRMLTRYPEYATTHAIRDRALRRSIEVGAQILAAEGLEPPKEFDGLMRHATRFQQSGRSRAFTPFDLSPDNIVVGKEMYFLDYEWAGFRNVGFDVACVIAGFPQFVFARPINDEEADVFITAWVREITTAWPRYGDQAKLEKLLVASLVGWALSSLSTMYADGIEGIIALAEQDQPLASGPARESFLRQADSTTFSEAELLIRRDLYETFEALSRFAARCSGQDYAVIAAYANQVAQRLAVRQP